MLSCAKCELIIPLIACLTLSVCSRKPIQSSGTLPSTQASEITPKSVAEHKAHVSTPISYEALGEWNKKARKPTFGLISGFYQLPVSMPAGAVYIEKGRVFGANYESFWLSNVGPKPYVILPASVSQAQIFSDIMNHLLDVGVRFVEVPMADAIQVLNSEKKVLEGKSKWFPGRSLPSGIDLLISIQNGEGLYGPAFVGRVVRTKDGQLLALSSQLNTGPWSLQPLLTQLVFDSLRRLAHENSE